MRVIYLVVLALSATCIGFVLGVVGIVLTELTNKYLEQGAELLGTYAVALTVPMTLVILVFAAAITSGLWAVRKLFNRGATIDFV